jgi:ring-1,2-phenylacetyl-CoA epoxidase subunit PaaA
MTIVRDETVVDDRLAVRYERWDEMTDEYRGLAARVASFQALAELVGVLPFTDWIRRAPDFVRKQMLVAKIQDEVGHGHVMARVAEDLGIPREKILRDFVDGKTKLLNIFHYDFETWEEIGPAALLMNSSAIVQFQSLDRGTYLPYARALKKIEKEEGFHYHHALDLTHQVLREGNAVQRARVQTAFDTWFPRLIAYFGPPDSDTFERNPGYRAGIKVDSNDALRQRWIAKIVPVFQELGVHVDESLASFDVEANEWTYASPDWNEVKAMLTHGGPTYQRWVTTIAGSLERNERYRRAALAA